MPQYLVEYDARLWIDATDEDEARQKANELTGSIAGIEFDYPDVEKV